jgi:hypothetical protein
MTAPKKISLFRRSTLPVRPIVAFCFVAMLLLLLAESHFKLVGRIL